MKKIAVFASGKGTNLQAIIYNIARGSLRASIALVVSDNRYASALKKAQKAGIKTLYADPKKFGTKENYEKFLLDNLKKEKVDFVVLAGFMRIISAFFIKRYKRRILNIHPSLLPSFKGACGIKDAFCYGVKVTGVTVHLVDERVDHGPIIMQVPVPILGGDSLEKLEQRIHKAEHKIYPQAIQKVLSRTFVVRGRKVVFLPK